MRIIYLVSCSYKLCVMIGGGVFLFGVCDLMMLIWAGRVGVLRRASCGGGVLVCASCYLVSVVALVLCVLLFSCA